MRQRYVMYIDGYNFYYAISRFRQTTPLYLGWCDFGRLAAQYMVPSSGDLVAIKYFTAHVGDFGRQGDECGSEARRQAVWLSAVGTIANIKVIEGFHDGDSSTSAEARARSRKEKQTDVNIAVSMVVDAAAGSGMDHAILVTGDRDLIPAVSAVTRHYGKHVDVWLPPNRALLHWKFLEAPVPGVTGRIRVREITRQMLERSRLPERLVAGDGSVVQAPALWRKQ